MVLRHRISNFRWEMITVYGSAHPEKASDFITELSRKCFYTTLLVVMGSDFNLFRSPSENNNDNINQGLMDKFKMFIELHQLQEIRRSDSKYTWINKQKNPIMITLDRILVSTKWEAKFPLYFAWSKIRVDSNNWPTLPLLL
jgi:hypothetical protein